MPSASRNSQISGLEKAASPGSRETLYHASATGDHRLQHRSRGNHIAEEAGKDQNCAASSGNPGNVGLELDLIPEAMVSCVPSTFISAVARMCRAKYMQSQNDSFLTRISGVIHVGANTGQERGLYDSFGLNV